MTEMRLRASRRVRRRGLSGKLDSCEMSLSVKSIASWSYTIPEEPEVRDSIVIVVRSRTACEAEGFNVPSQRPSSRQRGSCVL